MITVANFDRRPWADLPSDLLDLIYAKLPPDAAVEFGFVCKNWHQFHTAAAAPACDPLHPPPLTPPRGGRRRRYPIDVSSHLLRRGVPNKPRRQLSGAYVIHIWGASGWWLLAVDNPPELDCDDHDDRFKIVGCFNPGLLWPSNLIRFPKLTLRNYKNTPLPPIKAAFFAPEAATDGDDWSVFLVESGSRFWTLRGGQRRWWSYGYSDKKERVCAGIGYKDGKLVCLFETGDVMMFAIGIGIRRGGGKRSRRMFVASPPLAAGQLATWDNVRVVAADVDGKKVEGSGLEVLTVTWERGGGGDGGFRLLKVESGTMPAAVAAEIRRLDGGVRWWRLGRGAVLATEQRGVIKCNEVEFVVGLVWTLGFVIILIAVFIFLH